MSHAGLHAARRAKNDEFYTRFEDITAEVLRYDASQWQGKTVLLPADDPEWSNFTKFFALKFEELGLRKLIATSYNPGGQGKVFTLEGDADGSGIVDPDDLRWTWLDGDGDFRSPEVTALRDEADIIVTNPPFSLFREFFAWVAASEKKFLLIANKMSVKYADIAPFFEEDRTWAGYRNWSGGMWFEVPAGSKKIDKVVDGTPLRNVASAWITNLDHGRRHEPIALMTMSDNLRFGKAMKGKSGYDRYDNFDAIEVPTYKAIPSDYDGVMGVPITFLDKYCPEQFEIIGMWNAGVLAVRLGIPKTVTVTKSKGAPKVIQWNGPVVNQQPKADRILIRHRNPTPTAS